MNALYNKLKLTTTIFFIFISSNVYTGHFLAQYRYEIQQKEEKELLSTPTELKPTVESLIHNAKLVHILTEKLNIKDYTNIQATQTKKHIGENLNFVSNLFLKHNNLNLPKVKEFLLKIYKKEKEEHSKGNYVFYHGRTKSLAFFADIYKQLWNITKKDNIGDDFTFLRFKQHKEIKNIRNDCLFMNHALFGNSNESTVACTISQYWLKDRSIHEVSLFETKFLRDLFQKFEVLESFEKYKKDLEILSKLHKQLSKYGEILLISIPDDKINLVKPVLPSGRFTVVRTNSNNEIINLNKKNKEEFINELTTKSTSKEVLEMLMKNPEKVKIYEMNLNSFEWIPKSSDYIEWTLPLTKDYALDPHHGPRIYSFLLADEKLMQQYIKLRNEIFGKIKKELEEKQSYSNCIAKL